MANRFMQQAIEESLQGMRSGDGGPFGAVITQNGEIIASAHNEVLKTNDPTAHAEIAAIRRAAEKLGRFDLSDCEIYSSCEPCPMCLSAIYWAKISMLHYGNTAKDAADAGFDDQFIYDAIRGNVANKRITILAEDREDCKIAFDEWNAKIDKTTY